MESYFEHSSVISEVSPASEGMNGKELHMIFLPQHPVVVAMR